jgi:hypothetical protein
MRLTWTSKCFQLDEQNNDLMMAGRVDDIFALELAAGGRDETTG